MKKTLKELEMPNINCGLDALSKIGNLKNVSAFTLIHLGRDNGINLNVFKVANKEDLIRVIRPAIFHQKDHFVYVKEDEAMPEGEYSGFVIGAQVLGRVVSLSEAKFIKGGKKGGAIRSIIAPLIAITTTIIGGVIGGPAGAAAGAKIGTALGAGAAAGTDQYAKSNHPEQLGQPGKIGDIIGAAALGGLEAYGAGSLTTGALGAGQAAGGSTLASSVPGQGAGAANAINAASFEAAKQTGTGLAGQVGAFNAVNAASAAGAGALAGQTAAFGGGTSSSGIGTGTNAANAFGAATNPSSVATGAFGGGTAPFTAPGSSFNPTSFSPSSDFSLSNIQFTPEASSSLGISDYVKGGWNGLKTAANNTGNAISKATGGFLPGGAGGLATGVGGINNLASAVGAAGVFGSQAPEYQGATPTENYSAVQQFLGPSALGQATNDQLQSYVNTPIEDLSKQFTSDNTRVTNAINQSYDNQKQSLIHAYAQAGQNLANSTELQTKVTDLEQKRTNDITLANEEVANHALTQAVQVKQQALSQGMQAGQWNQNLAMQLAQLTGDQQNLQYAIANNDYAAFQQIMGKLMTMGLPQNVKLS